LQRGQGMLLFTWKPTQGLRGSQMLRWLRIFGFQWFFLYCLCLPILDCNVSTDYLALCTAYIFTFNVKARRSWRGGRWWSLRNPKAWVAVGQLMSVHCIAAASFPCISVASQRFLLSIWLLKNKAMPREWLLCCTMILSSRERERPSSDARDRVKKSRQH